MKSKKLISLFKKAVMANAIDVNDAEMKKMLSVIAQNYYITYDYEDLTDILAELVEATKNDIETMPDEYVNIELAEIFDELDENDRIYLLNALTEIIADSDEKFEDDSEFL
ncbi:MAG: hypothetical protein FWC41_02145 [Firmicutes bacterium]|nr:hypothetical protein [Bacillota bacterium]